MAIPPNLPPNPFIRINAIAEDLDDLRDDVGNLTDAVINLQQQLEERLGIQPNPAAPQPVNPDIQATAANAEALFLRQLPNLKIYTDYHPNSDNIKARIVERMKANGKIEKKIIGYYDGSSWLYCRWAFAPLTSGNVPTMEGSKLDSGISTWRRDHVVAGFFGPISGTRYCPLPSGDEFGYTTSQDQNGLEYILVPANGQGDFTGYVPARDLMKSLKNGYLVNPDGFKLVYDKMGVLHLASHRVKYENHGFELHGRVWWPVKSGAYGDHAAAIEQELAVIDQKVRKFLARKI